MCLRCPVCDEEVTTDEDNPNPITAESVKFPDHFFHTSAETGAVDICNQEKIREWLKDGVKFLRENKGVDDWYSMSGNLYVNVHRFVGDEEYDVIVSNDYYEVTIPFQNADYLALD